MANEYVSVATFKAAQGITVTTYDTDLASKCTAASRGIDDACDRRFWADADATQVRYYQPHGLTMQWPGPRSLRIDDLVTLTSVKTDTSGDGTFGTTLVQNTDFVAEDLNAAADGWPFTRLTLNPNSGAYWPAYPRSVKVTGKFGWAAVPDEIVQATMILFNILFKRNESPFGIVTAGVDQQTAMRIAQTDPTIRTLIRSYVRPVV